MTDPSLARLFRPASIAFVGGAQMAGPIRACRRAGYAGRLYMVNPARSDVEGLACLPGIADLPEPPDAAVIGLSPEKAIEAVARMSALGAGGAVVMASGFAELGAPGQALQNRLVAAAGSMPLIGPNCMGILNLFDGAAAWGDDNLIERPEGRGAAIVSQSGAMLIGITNVERAFPLGYAISTGNQAATDMARCIHGLLEDERVNAIGLYLEGMGDGAALGAACLAARARGVPVVALKGGDQSVGAAVALSHTASMMLERDLWEAFCARFGVAEVSSPKALVETLKLLSVAGLPRGNRLSVVSYSGGINGLAATRATALGLTLPPPGHPAELRACMPDTVAIANPLDLNIPFQSSTGISMRDTDLVARAISLFGTGSGDQITFLIDVPRPGAEGLDRVWCDSLEAMIGVRAELGIPTSVAAILPEGLPQDFRAHLQRHGVAALQGFSEALEAHAVAARLSAAEPDLAAAPLYRVPPVCAQHMLDEAQAKARLAAHGLALAPHAAVPLADAGAAADRLGYPVALKVLSTTIAHKARLGGVVLNLHDRDAVTQAAARIAASVEAASDRHPVTHLLVERMIAGAQAEIILGIKRDPAVGLALMIGLGGSRAEVVARFETVLLPLDATALDAALARLGLAGHAGLRAAALAVAGYAEAERDTIVTLDVNPVILTADGAAIAADALVVLGAPVQ